jgi:transcriptional regulator with XRE-family HTH domain
VTGTAGASRAGSARRTVGGVDAKRDLQEFLTTRRARRTPDAAGLPTFGGRRRVPGLRREEVALLSGVSVDYYTKLERGNARGVSDSVLDAIARALRLDEAERSHLFALARACGGPTRPGRRRVGGEVRPSVRRILASLSTPAYLRNHWMDVLAVNDVGFALYDGVLSPESLPTNLGRFLFLDPSARDFFLEWEAVADDMVSMLRAEAGRSPHDKALSDLVGELATGSEPFAERWGRHDVRFHRTAPKRLHSSLVGDVELIADAMELPGDGLVMISYTAEPGTPAEDALRFLASWASGAAGSASASRSAPTPAAPAGSSE